MRHLLPLPFLILLLGAAHPETRLSVMLPAGFANDAAGRLLIFAEPATAANANTDAIDVDADSVAVAARDVASFGRGRAATVDTEEAAYPTEFAALPPGAYRVQAVLDRDGSYNYGGRGSGDLISKVVTIRFPLASVSTIALNHAVPAEPGQFDVAGLPPRAAEQITASQAHLHDERIVSPLLTRFRGTPQSIAAWVLTPPGYDPAKRKTYPTVYTAGGFGATHRLDGQQLSRQWHMMETGEIPPMIWVALDFGSRTGTTEFADSVNNGPWGQALVGEVIPALERRYRMDARPSGRFLTGHSSGGWFALWAVVRYPSLFSGSWATSPDPVDFHDFLGVDLYAPDANMYRDSAGRARPMERNHGKVERTIAQAARLETVLGHDGGQVRSFEWVFSPRRADGTPAPMFDRESGAVDPDVAAYWRDHYDISRYLETEWTHLRKPLDGKVHVAVGSADSFYLDGSVRRLQSTFARLGGHAEFTFVPGASHAMSEVYARDGDRAALWKSMTRAMYEIARPGRSVPNEAREDAHEPPRS